MAVDRVPLQKNHRRGTATSLLAADRPSRRNGEGGNEYIMTPSLNAIAQNDFVIISSDCDGDGGVGVGVGW